MQKQKNVFNKLLNKDETGMTIFLLIMCLFIGSINNAFFLPSNLINLLRTSSLTILAGVGLTLVLISGHIDLSIGSVIGLGSMITGLLIMQELPLYLCIILGAASGALAGLFNGIVITKFKIPPLIVTLGSMYFIRGIVNVISGGRTVYPFPEEFILLGGKEGPLGIPFMVWIALAVCIIGHITLRYTVLGRCIYAIGGNKETSRVSGIKVDNVIIGCYVITGVLAAFSGVIQASKVNSSIASAGTGWELTVMAAVVIGGTSMFGGVGSIFGTVIGALVLTVLTNGMVMLSINAFWQNVVLGMIIILAVGMDQYKRTSMLKKNTKTTSKKVVE